MTRILLAGLLGGLAMMAAAFVLHRPPLDGAGWANLPDEPPVQAALSGTIGRASGLYVYPALPGLPGGHGAPAPGGPSGLILYLAAGDEVDPARSMAEELVKTILIATAAAALLTQTSATRGYPFGVGFVAAIGAMVAVSTHFSNHAWFGFPISFTAGRIALDFGPWLVGSLVIAAVARPSVRRGLA
jgi:hypothetical protein